MRAYAFTGTADAARPDEAFLIIRAYARSHNRRLIDLAHAIVDDLSSLPGLARL